MEKNYRDKSQQTHPEHHYFRLVREWFEGAISPLVCRIDGIEFDAVWMIRVYDPETQMPSWRFMVEEPDTPPITLTEDFEFEVQRTAGVYQKATWNEFRYEALNTAAQFKQLVQPDKWD